MEIRPALTLKQAAAYLGLSTRQVNNKIEKGIIPVIDRRISKHVRIRPEALETFFKPKTGVTPVE